MVMVSEKRNLGAGSMRGSHVSGLVKNNLAHSSASSIFPRRATPKVTNPNLVIRVISRLANCEEILPTPRDLDYAYHAHVTYNRFATSLWKQGEKMTAISVLHRAMEIPRLEDWTEKIMRAKTHSNLAFMLLRVGEKEEARYILGKLIPDLKRTITGLKKGSCTQHKLNGQERTRDGMREASANDRSGSRDNQTAKNASDIVTLLEEALEVYSTTMREQAMAGFVSYEDADQAVQETRDEFVYGPIRSVLPSGGKAYDNDDLFLPVVHPDSGRLFSSSSQTHSRHHNKLHMSSSPGPVLKLKNEGSSTNNFPEGEESKHKERNTHTKQDPLHNPPSHNRPHTSPDQSASRGDKHHRPHPLENRRLMHTTTSTRSETTLHNIMSKQNRGGSKGGSTKKAQYNNVRGAPAGEGHKTDKSAVADAPSIGDQSGAGAPDGREKEEKCESPREMFLSNIELGRKRGANVTRKRFPLVVMPGRSGNRPRPQTVPTNNKNTTNTNNNSNNNNTTNTNTNNNIRGTSSTNLVVQKPLKVDDDSLHFDERKEGGDDTVDNDVEKDDLQPPDSICVVGTRMGKENNGFGSGDSASGASSSGLGTSSTIDITSASAPPLPQQTQKGVTFSGVADDAAAAATSSLSSSPHHVPGGGGGFNGRPHKRLSSHSPSMLNTYEGGGEKRDSLVVRTYTRSLSREEKHDGNSNMNTNVIGLRRASRRPSTVPSIPSLAAARKNIQAFVPIIKEQQFAYEKEQEREKEEEPMSPWLRDEKLKSSSLLLKAALAESIRPSSSSHLYASEEDDKEGHHTYMGRYGYMENSNNPFFVPPAQGQARPKQVRGFARAKNAKRDELSNMRRGGLVIPPTLMDLVLMRKALEKKRKSNRNM